MDLPTACKLRLCNIVLELAKEKSAQESKTMRSVARECHTHSSRKDECNEKKD